MLVLFCDNGLEPFLNFRGDVAKHFHDKGWRTVLAVPADTCNKNDKILTPDFIEVMPVKMNKNGSNPMKDLSYMLWLIKLMRKIKPDIVFTYTIKPNIYGSMAARVSSIPIVAMVAGLGYAFNGDSLKHRLGRSLYKFGLRRANKVIVLNEANRGVLISHRFVLPEDVILFEGGEGVDLRRFDRVIDDYGSVRFLMVARVLYDKGYREYVKAARIVKEKYPGIRIELLGPLAEDSPMGVPKSEVEKDIQTGAINYLGATDDVKGIVGENGVVVVLSSYHEGFNRSLMEACAMGRICITSDIAGCKEIVEDGYNGYLVRPKDGAALAKAMIKILECDKTERLRMADNSRQKAERQFDVMNVLRNYDEIVDTLVRKR